MLKNDLFSQLFSFLFIEVILLFFKNTFLDLIRIYWGIISVKIKKIKRYRDIKPLMKDYFKTKQIPKDAQKILNQRLQTRLESDDFIGYFISKNRRCLGFTLLCIDKLHIEEYMHYFKETSLKDKALVMLLDFAANKAKDLGKILYQSFFVKNLDLKEILEEKGFETYIRARMSYNIPENYSSSYDLDVCYKLSNFTPERLEPIKDVIVQANKDHIDGEIFIQFSDYETLSRFIDRSLGDLSRLRRDSPVILYGDQIVGVNLIVMLSEARAYIWDIAVLSAHQRKGLGKALMDKAIENCIQNTIPEILLDVTVDNHKAFNFYNKLGFVELSRYLTVVKRFTA